MQKCCQIVHIWCWLTGSNWYWTINHCVQSCAIMVSTKLYFISPRFTLFLMIFILFCVFFRWIHSRVHGTMLHVPSFLLICIHHHSICYFSKVNYCKINARCLSDSICLINVKYLLYYQVYVEMLPIVHIWWWLIGFNWYWTINHCLQSFHVMVSTKLYFISPRFTSFLMIFILFYVFSDVFTPKQCMARCCMCLHSIPKPLHSPHMLF